MQNTQTAHTSSNEPFKYGSPIKFFHSFTKDGDIQYQGFIDTIEAGGNASGVLFSFADGSMNGRIYLTRSELENCTFYGSDVEMRNAHAELNKIWERKQKKFKDAI